MKNEKTKKNSGEGNYMPPITHGQNDVQTILRGTLYPMLYAPDTITILHLNTNNAFFFLSFFRFFFLGFVFYLFFFFFL